MIGRAAIRGEGVVLGRSALIGDELSSDRLVLQFDSSLPEGFAYYGVCPSRALKRAGVKAFRDWPISETHARKKIHRSRS